MASIHYYLRKRTDEPGLIILNVIFSKEQIIRYSTGKKCLPKDWNYNTQLARPCPTQGEINERIENLTTKVREILKSWQREGVNPNCDRLKELLLEYDGKKVVFNEGLSVLKRLEVLQHDSLNKGMKQFFRQACFHLERFSKIHGTIYLTDLDLEFLKKWRRYFNHATHSNGKTYSSATVANTIVAIRMVASQARDRGETINPLTLSKRFRIPSEETDPVYINIERLHILSELPLQKAVWSRIRDLFIIGAWTGLRYADVCKLTVEHLSEGYLRKVTRKTGRKVTIPIHQDILKVLERNKGRIPKGMDSSKANIYIKQVCREAGFTEMVNRVRLEGGVRAESQVEFYKLVGTHTARRSFATNAYKEGLDVYTVMSMTSHRTISAFMKYICITDEEIADRIRQHPFFSGK